MNISLSLSLYIYIYIYAHEYTNPRGSCFDSLPSPSWSIDLKAWSSMVPGGRERK